MESHDRSKKSFERKDRQPSAGKSSGRPTRKSTGASGERSYDRKPKPDGSGQRSGRPSDRKPREGGSSSSGERSYDRKPREGGSGRTGERSFDRKPRAGGSDRSAERSSGRPGSRSTDRPFHRRREERVELIPRTEDQKIYDGPPIPDEVKLADLDKGIMRQLHGLPEKLADRIARHLVMAAHLMETDPETAYKHALAARARAARVGVVREACGETAYAAGKWAEALSELRAAKRLTGAVDYVPVMADCERALGRPQKAIEMDTPALRKKFDSGTAIEMSIVVAGARADLGQFDAALRVLEREPLNSSDRSAPIARLRYAYADMLLKAGRKDEAIEWFHRTVGIDAHGETEAEDRLRELGA